MDKGNFSVKKLKSTVAPADDHPVLKERPVRHLRWFVAVAVMSAALLAPATAPAADAVGCGYGTGGPAASNLCWFDMSG